MRVFRDRFYDWRVVWVAFVLAAFGLGIGFHGPAVYLHAVHDSRGWSLSLVSAAVTVHFVAGALVTANLPVLYRRWGLATVTRGGAVILAMGVLFWALAATPSQLFCAAVISGIGWGTMGVAAINAFVAPWFVTGRPAALALAYNGANVGGVVFLPLWATAIAMFGFPVSALVIGVAMVATVWVLAGRVLSRTPERMGLSPDGDAASAPAAGRARDVVPRPGRALWRNPKFLTLTAGMALGLFAQIGLVAHLFSLLAPALGTQAAGWAAALVTAMAIAGRTVIGWLMPVGADRRLIACASYGVQALGCLAFLLASGNAALLLVGVVLFGVGFGNGTWLPPLIAQAEFSEADVTRLVPVMIAVAQATYAFAPAVFGVIRDVGALLTPIAGNDTAPFFLTVAAFQLAAIALFLAGRGR